MKLRVVQELWKDTARQYTVQRWSPYANGQGDWVWVSSHEYQSDAELSAQLMLKGPTIIKEYNTEVEEFEDHTRTFC